MVNTQYTKGKEKFLKGEIDLTNDTILALLVNTDIYPVSINGDEYLETISLEARVATSTPLLNPTVNDGTFKADNTIVEEVSGIPVQALVIYKEGTNEENSPLIAYIDTQIETVSGVLTEIPLTFQPDGSDVPLNWNDEGIFSI